MKVAIVHEWLTLYVGSERVLEQMLTVFPDADLYCLVDFLPEDQRHFLGNRKPKTSYIQKLPFARKHYRSYLPLMPLAVEQFNLSGYDLVISSSHAVAKGVLCGPDQLHVCMCYSPLRYAWDLQHQYLKEAGLDHGASSLFARILLHYMRLWDVRTANGVDAFIAISEFVQRRIQKSYRRDSTVIYPGIDPGRFQCGEQKENFYLTASRMVPYKRIDLIVSAFSRTPNRQLVVIGDGPDFDRIKRLAGPNVQLLGYQSSEILRDYMARAKAFVFAAEEDFGIVVLEAQASGTPVLCYARGGATETVLPGVTGVFFDSQTEESIIAAVEEFEGRREDFCAARIRKHAEQFSVECFRSIFSSFIQAEFEKFHTRERVTA